MKTRLVKTPLKDLVVVEIDYFQDERGFLIETWNKHDFQKAGLDLDFVQEVHSQSKYKVLRGLHFQTLKTPQAKLIRCVYGNAFTVAVDLRANSKTFGKCFSITLSSEDKKQLFVPVGFAFGFATLTDTVELLYKLTGFYNPSAEKVLMWNDSHLAISWPFKDPLISPRDAKGITFLQYKSHPDFE